MRGLEVMMSARQSPGMSPDVLMRNARSRAWSNSVRSTGLVRNASAPLCVAFTASGIVPCAVSMITGHAGMLLLQCAQQRDAVHAVHAQVGDDGVGPARLHRLERGCRALRGVDAEAVLRQPDAHETQQSGIIVDEQDPPLRLAGFGFIGAPSRAGSGSAGACALLPSRVSSMDFSASSLASRLAQCALHACVLRVARRLALFQHAVGVAHGRQLALAARDGVQVVEPALHPKLQAGRQRPRARWPTRRSTRRARA